MKQRSVRWMAKVAILGALATILMLVEIPIPFIAPSTSTKSTPAKSLS
ncbi:MAG: hypothetical protein MZU97_19390 [Bacillus subtilis]|nr:hypothetical protein [Bacillus subtilis]